MAALIHQALLERVRNGRRVSAPAALAVGVTALLGLLDESIQAMLPSRVFDVRDILFNALAGFMVIVARLAIAPPRRPGWRIWFLWLMAGAFGWGMGMEWGSFGEPRRFETLQFIPTMIVPGYLSVAVGGILGGVLQWLVLRPHVARAGRWVLASLGAAAVVSLVVFGVSVVNPDVGWVGGAGLYGAVVGVLQWLLVLRRQIPQAGWWVVASTMGWIVGMPAGGIIAWPALGGAYAVVTGTVLVWLLRQGPPAFDQPQRSL